MTATANFFLCETRLALGTAGEMKVKELLEASGYTVDASHPHKCGDLRVIDTFGNVFYVEVKTARATHSKTRNDGFAFSLYRKLKKWIDKRGKEKEGRVCTDHTGTDFTILVCVFKSGRAEFFVIPTEVIERITQITIPANTWNYAGKYARFRQKEKELRLQ